MQQVRQKCETYSQPNCVKLSVFAAQEKHTVYTGSVYEDVPGNAMSVRPESHIITPSTAFRVSRTGERGEALVKHVQAIPTAVNPA
jgi:hypothetical protein